MAKYRIIIEKCLDNDIEAKTEEEAVDIAREMWLHNDEISIFVEEYEEE